MALKTHATIILDVQDFLGQNTGDFTSPLLTKTIEQALVQFSHYAPFIAQATLATTDDSKELNITSIKNKLWVAELEYKTGKTPRQFIRWDEHYRNMLSMDITTKPADADSGIATDEAVDNSETGIDVTPTAATAIPVGTIIRIDNELMYVSVTGTTLTVVRGYLQTTATTHDTATSIYIPELAYLYVAKTHKIPTITDLAGAVDLVAGYTAGVRTIHIDTMGTSDTLKEDWTFTIASDGSGTVYRLTQDTVLASNEGDITFEPGLAEAIANTDVVTFDNSTFELRLEPLFIKLVAALAALNNPFKLMIQVNDGGVRVPITMAEMGRFWLAEVTRELEAEARKHQRPTPNQ